MNYHSLKAYHDSISHHKNKTHVAAALIHESGEDGLTATEMSKIIGACCKHEVSPALSRALKRYADEIVYQKQEGETHGRYYCRCFL